MPTTTAMPASEDSIEFRQRTVQELAQWREADSPGLLVLECTINPAVLGKAPVAQGAHDCRPRMSLLCADDSIEVVFELFASSSAAPCPFVETAHVVEHWVKPALGWLGLPANITQPSFGKDIRFKTTPNHGHTMHIYFPKQPGAVGGREVRSHQRGASAAEVS